MNKKTASLLLTLLAAVLLALPGRSWAADTTLTAQVPSTHTLTLALDAGVRTVYPIKTETVSPFPGTKAPP